MESDKIDYNIFDFPEEILLHIFKYFKDLNETDLISAANVCQRFRTAAKNAFSSKYNGDAGNFFYQIKEINNNYAGDKELHQPYFNMFGTHMTAVKIQFCENTKIDDNHWLVKQLVKKDCTSLKKLEIEGGVSFNMPWVLLFDNLTHLTLDAIQLINWDWTNIQLALTHLYVKRLQDFKQNHLEQFMKKNPQLQHLSLIDCTSFTLNVVNILNSKNSELLTLELSTLRNSTFSSGSTLIGMHRLKSLSLIVDDMQSLALFFQAIGKGSKNIREICLDSNSCVVPWDGLRDDFAKSICLFNNLETFEVIDFYMNIEQVKLILRRLSHIKSLTVFINEPLNNNDILSIASVSNVIEKIHLVLIYWRLNMRCEIQKVDFHDQFLDAIYKNRDLHFTISASFSANEILITKEMIIEDGGIVTWTGAKTLHIYNDTHHNLLDLNDRCLQKIINFLDINSQCVLYRTCERFKKLVKEIVSLQCEQRIFTIDLGNIKNEEEIFPHLGKHITFVKLQNEDPLDESNQLLQFWNAFVKYCGSHIIEMIIDVDFDYEVLFDSISSDLLFPKLQILKIESILDSTTLSSFKCPKLWCLEIQWFQPRSTFDIGGAFNHLSSLKFGSVDKDVVAILKRMNEAACNKLQELSLNGSTWITTENQQHRNRINTDLVNVIIKFRYLLSLNLKILGIERANTKYLFQNCSKLKKFSFFYCKNTNEKNAMEMLRHVKDNCKQIEIIHVDSFNDRARFLRAIATLFPKGTIQ